MDEETQTEPQPAEGTVMSPETEESNPHYEPVTDDDVSPTPEREDSETSDQGGASEEG